MRRVRYIQAVMFTVGTFLIFDRTFRVSTQLPLWEILLNIAETAGGVILFMLALGLK